MVEIYSINIASSISKSKYAELLLSISNEKRSRIDKFYYEVDKKRALFGEALIRYLILKHKGIRNEKIAFVYNEFGKPYLNHSSNFYFNISHSGDWVICAIGSHEIGVDIEQIEPIETEELARGCFTKMEYDELIKKSEEERNRFFFSIWTLKESYVKWIGKGLTISFDSFRFEINDKIEVISDVNKKVNFNQYCIDEKHIVSVCSKEESFPSIIKDININDILL